jgi:peroxisomal membrane protein 2
LQEVLGSTLSGAPVQRPSKNAPFILHVLANVNVDLKAFKMAIYGFLVSAPTSHVLTGALQKAFAGKTSTGAKIAQLLANNLLVAPIQTASKWVQPCVRPAMMRVYDGSLLGFYGYHQRSEDSG